MEFLASLRANEANTWEDPKLRISQYEGMNQANMLRAQLESQKQLADLQRAQAMEIAKLNLGPQNRALDLQQSQFDYKKNMANNFLGQLSGILKAQSASAPQITRGPAIEVGPVFSPEEMAMQQNRVFDRSMQQAAGVTNRFNQGAAARGVSGSSPFLPRIRAMTETQGRVGGEGAALDFARQMATENAKNSLASQQLRQEQENQYQQNLLSRYGIDAQRGNYFLNSLSGLFGSI